MTGRNKGGLLLPTYTGGKKGKKLADVIAYKHPSPAQPAVEAFCQYKNSNIDIHQYHGRYRGVSIQYHVGCGRVRQYRLCRMEVLDLAVCTIDMIPKRGNLYPGSMDAKHLHTLGGQQGYCHPPPHCPGKMPGSMPRVNQQNYSEYDEEVHFEGL